MDRKAIEKTKHIARLLERIALEQKDFVGEILKTDCAFEEFERLFNRG